MAVPDIGDLVAVLDVGAYGFSQSMPFFASYPIPPEVVIDGDTAVLARPRIDPQTWLEMLVGDEGGVVAQENVARAIPEEVGVAETPRQRPRAAQGG